MSEELLKRAREELDNISHGNPATSAHDLIDDLVKNIETLENTVKMVENPHLVLQLSNRVSELEYLIQVVWRSGQVRELPTAVAVTWNSVTSELAFKHKKPNGS